MKAQGVSRREGPTKRPDAPLNATKWAVEALGEYSRNEHSELGIETCIVEPGAFAANFMDRLLLPSDHCRDASYGDMVYARKQSIESFEGAIASSPVQDPQDVAHVFVNLISGSARE